MKTSIDAVSSVETKITVEIPAAEVDQRSEEQFAEIRREVPLKGFRRGKAPIDMVRRMFKESVEKDLSDRIARETLADVVKEKDIKILSLGKVDAGKVASGEPFTFSVVVEVVPEVEAKDYKGIPVRTGQEKVKDEDVEAAIERLRTPHAKFLPEQGRKAQRGDLAEFSFSAVTDGGEPVDENEKTSIVLINGIPFGQEFEDNMMGVGAGDERSFRVVYPATHPHSKYAGKTVDFKVKVFTVRERSLPVLDDEFVRGFGVEGLADLRVKMREKLEREAGSKSRHATDEEIRRKLAERNPIEVPRRW
jgi:trigger factor